MCLDQALHKVKGRVIFHSILAGGSYSQHSRWGRSTEGQVSPKVLWESYTHEHNSDGTEQHTWQEVITLYYLLLLYVVKKMLGLRINVVQFRAMWEQSS